MKKRLARVEVTLTHGTGCDRPDIHEVIDVLPGQRFVQGIVRDELRENSVVIRSWDWRAGYTIKYTYLYV